MNKIALVNAHIVDPEQKLNKKGILLVEGKKISNIITNKNIKFKDKSFKIFNCFFNGIFFFFISRSRMASSTARSYSPPAAKQVAPSRGFRSRPLTQPHLRRFRRSASQSSSSIH